MNKILEYAGQYKKNYFWSVTLVLLAVFAQVIPYLFLYKLVIHIIGIETYTTNQRISYVVIIAICLLLYTFLYTKGLEFSHIAAYNTLKNLRIYLQERMEKMPLGVITAIGNGTFKKMFVDDIETLELLLVMDGIVCQYDSFYFHVFTARRYLSCADRQIVLRQIYSCDLPEYKYRCATFACYEFRWQNCWFISMISAPVKSQ